MAFDNEQEVETTPVDPIEEDEEQQEEAADDEDQDDGDKSKDDVPEVDWQKVADDEKAARKAAEDKLAGIRFKGKHKKGKESDDSDLEDDDLDDDEEDRPLTVSELNRIRAQDRADTQRDILAGRITEIADKLAASPAEAAAIKAIHSNRIFPAGMSIEDQLNEAYYIAHGPRLVAKQAELRRAIRSKTAKKPAGSEDTHRDEPKNAPKVDPQVKTELVRQGYKWDGTNFSKTLKNGDTLVRDVKNKKTYVIRKK